MGLELERKYLHVDLCMLRATLRAAHAQCLGAHMETNWVFDRGTELRDAGRLLRVRTQQWPDKTRHLLTLKLPAPFRPPLHAVDASASPGLPIKVREEQETVIADGDSLRHIFACLGYAVIARYEKVREPWLLDGVEVELDVLPFDEVVELEGPADALDSVAHRLGLDAAPVSDKTYHDLHQDWLFRHSLPRQDSFIFEDDVRAAWRKKLGLPS